MSRLSRWCVTAGRALLDAFGTWRVALAVALLGVAIGTSGLFPRTVFVPGQTRLSGTLAATLSDSASGFTDPAHWATFNPHPHVGGKPGYSSVVTAGTYVYFLPSFGFPGVNQTTVLRHRWGGDFGSPDAYAAFDLRANGITTQKGYAGGVYDGRYLYLVPNNNDGTFHGEVVRYDTEAAFGSPDSWSAFDPGDHGVGEDPDGYMGNAVFDGRYVYFSPHLREARADAPDDDRGEVLRYDTKGGFADPASWSTFDPTAVENEDAHHGFFGAAFDGRFVYFLPFNDEGTQLGGEVVRYDTARPFRTSAAWSAFDVRAHDIGEAGVAYTDAAFDGRYLYLAPQRRNGPTFGSHVVRYDTDKNFRRPEAWTDFAPAAHGVGTDPRGYTGVVVHGDHVYFSPTLRGFRKGAHGEVLRYDRTGGFTDPDAWSAFDPGAHGVGTDPDGYALTARAGPYVYFAPAFHTFAPDQSTSFAWHSEILRYDTRSSP